MCRVLSRNLPITLGIILVTENGDRGTIAEVRHRTNTGMAKKVPWLRKRVLSRVAVWTQPSSPAAAPSLARQVGLHADQDDLTALALE